MSFKKCLLIGLAIEVTYLAIKYIENEVASDKERVERTSKARQEIEDINSKVLIKNNKLSNGKCTKEPVSTQEHYLKPIQVKDALKPNIKLRKPTEEVEPPLPIIRGNNIVRQPKYAKLEVRY